MNVSHHTKVSDLHKRSRKDPTRRGADRLAMPRTVFALMLREMATTYGRSPGGYLWAIAEPVAGIALLTIIFSMAFAAPPLGLNFALFYASGFLPFMMYLNVQAKVGLTVRFSKPLLFYPAVRCLDAVLARFVLNFLTELVVMALVLGGLVIAFALNVNLDWSALGLAIAMAGALGLGVGTLNCYLIARFPVWERAWAVLNRPLFIVSTIFFLYESVPHPWGGVLWWNPLVHVIGQMRDALYPSYEADFVSPVFVFSVATACLTLGLAALNNGYREIINN